MSRGITAEDLYKWKWVSDPQVSPDGTQIAYVVKTVDQDAGEYRHAIWVVPTDGQIGDARRFTFGPKNDHTPRWSPDGKWLAFVSDREGPAGKDAKEEKAIDCPSGDQATSPSFQSPSVNWRASPPSAETRKIWRRRS